MFEALERKSVGRVLVVGQADVVGHVQDQLGRRGHEPVVASGGEDCLRLFREDGADLVVACLPVPGMVGDRLLDSLREADRSLNIVVCGSDRQVRGATEAFEHGAFEYVDDPISDPGELLAAVGVGLGSRRGDVQLRYLRQRDAASANFGALVGESAPMREVLRVVRLLCERSSQGGAPTVLVTGETGTGKGLLAKCIHYSGGRRTRPFVEVNCAAIPPSLLESELFGHERGAFTDAHAARAGLFETADRGTLFLDEIAATTAAVQAKLLTALEEKRIRRIGGRQAIQVDVQIVAATHMDLKEASKQGTFRADLYHRLNVVTVRMPSLRERGDDKIRLAETFVARTCAEYGLPPRVFSPEAKRYLLEYPWPGNVRELKNQIERIVLLYNEDVIDVDQFDVRRSSLPPAAPSGFRLSLPEEGISLDDIEREAIRAALERCGGNVSQTARFLRVTRQTVIYRMKKYGLTGDTSELE